MVVGLLIIDCKCFKWQRWYGISDSFFILLAKCLKYLSWYSCGSIKIPMTVPAQNLCPIRRLNPKYFFPLLVLPNRTGKKYHQECPLYLLRYISMVCLQKLTGHLTQTGLFQLLSASGAAVFPYAATCDTHPAIRNLHRLHTILRLPPPVIIPSVFASHCIYYVMLCYRRSVLCLQYFYQLLYYIYYYNNIMVLHLEFFMVFIVSMEQSFYGL